MTNNLSLKWKSHSCSVLLNEWMFALSTNSCATLGPFSQAMLLKSRSKQEFKDLLVNTAFNLLWVWTFIFLKLTTSSFLLIRLNEPQFQLINAIFFFPSAAAIILSVVRRRRKGTSMMWEDLHSKTGWQHSFSPMRLVHVFLFLFAFSPRVPSWLGFHPSCAAIHSSSCHCYSSGSGLHLQVQAKASPNQPARLAGLAAPTAITPKHDLLSEAVNRGLSMLPHWKCRVEKTKAST